MTSAYSTDKALLYPDRITGIRDGSVAPPVHVQIILSDWCNQNCSFCAYRMDGYTSNALFGVETDEGRDNNPRRFIPEDKAAEIIEDCSAMGVRGVQFTGGGEPTMHKRWADMIRLAQSKGLATALVTNGSWLPEKEDETLLSLAWIRVSLDAGDSGTYARIRQAPAAMFHAALQNIRRLSRKREHATSPTIGVGFVVTPENWTGVLEATKLARNNGADNIRIGAMFNPEDDRPYDKIRAEASALCREAEGFATNTFQVINRFDEKLEELHRGHPPVALCGYQYFTTYIGADLNVYRCCVYAYHPHGMVGSIKGQRFRDFWAGEGHKAALGGFDGRSCDRCQFTKINGTIRDAVEATPGPHDAFV